jgi:uncharacterized oxidoreductase
MKLTGNTILITGGGSGIGLALGETFTQRGNHVIAAGRNAQKLKVAERNGLSTVQVDMSDPASIQALAMTVSTEFPRVNVVIHNAAICEPVVLHRAGPRTNPRGNRRNELSGADATD